MEITAWFYILSWVICNIKSDGLLKECPSSESCLCGIIRHEENHTAFSSIMSVFRGYLDMWSKSLRNRHRKFYGEQSVLLSISDLSEAFLSQSSKILARTKSCLCLFLKLSTLLQARASSKYMDSWASSHGKVLILFLWDSDKKFNSFQKIFPIPIPYYPPFTLMSSGPYILFVLLGQQSGASDLNILCLCVPIFETRMTATHVQSYCGDSGS